MKIKGIDPEGLTFTLPELTCKVCSKTWFSRKNGKINNCPACRSTNWNLGIEIIVKAPILTCPKCQHTWGPRNMKLKECSICKKKLFNTREK